MKQNLLQAEPGAIVLTDNIKSESQSRVARKRAGDRLGG